MALHLYYNIIYIDELKRITNLGEKNKQASAKWNSLPKAEQQEWMQKATVKKSVSYQLDAATKEKLIDQHIKLIAKEVCTSNLKKCYKLKYCGKIHQII